MALNANPSCVMADARNPWVSERGFKWPNKTTRSSNLTITIAKRTQLCTTTTIIKLRPLATTTTVSIPQTTTGTTIQGTTELERKFSV